MKACLKVKAGEVLSTEEFIQELIYDGNRVLAFDCDGVQVAIIHTETPCVVLLFHQEYWRRERTATFLNETMLQHVGYLTLNLSF